KAKNTLQKNIQFDSKEKTQEKVKKDKTKKSDSKSKEEVSKEEEIKERPTPVPIEGMKQTSLPIGDVTHSDNDAQEETENEENEDDNERSEEHTSELQSRFDLVCRLLLEKKNI